MNRRKPVLIAITVSMAILIIGVIVSSWNNTPQTIIKAKITDFTADTSFKGCIVGVTTDIWFNVTVKNTGNRDITGANVTVEISGVNDTSISSYDNQSLDILHVNETRQVNAIILTDVSHFYQVASSNFTARLIVDGTVMDEKTYYTPTTTPTPAATPTPSVTITYWEVNRTFTSNATAIFIDWTLGGSSVSYNPNGFYLVDKGVRISFGPSYTSYPYTTKQYPILDLVVDGIYRGNSYQLANDYIFQVGNNHSLAVTWVKK